MKFQLCGRILLNLLSCFFFYNSKAQVYETPEENKWEVALNTGVFKESIIDKSFSSLPYTGYSLGGSVSIDYNKKKAFYHLMFYYMRGNLHSAGKALDYLENNYFNIDLTQLYKLNKEDNVTTIYKVGSSLNLLSANRKYLNYINNSYSFEFAASLSGAFEFSHVFKNRLAGLSFSNQVICPLITVAGQPHYSRSNDDNNTATFQSFFNDSKVLFFSEFFRLKNTARLRKVLSSRQALSLDYVWDYYKFTTIRVVQQANHRLGLTYEYKF